MFEYVEIKNGIKLQDVKVDFTKGFLPIVGENGAGKSLLIEFLKFALFGVKALRGKREDYPKLYVRTIFVIKDRRWEVERTMGDATLYQNGDAVVYGTKPVNEKVEELLGYDLTIFDFANCAMQNRINELGDLPAGQRKAAIDKVVGLSKLDNVLSELKGEEREIKVQLETLQKVLVEPVAPTKPENYQDSAKLQKEAYTVFTLEKGAEGAPDEEPEPFEDPDRQKEIETRLYRLEGVLEDYVEPKLDMETVEENLARWEIFKKLKRLPEKPPEGITLEQLKKQEAWETNFYAVKKPERGSEEEILRLLTVAEAQQEIESKKEVSCPECGTSFYPETDPDVVKLANSEKRLSVRELQKELRTFREYNKLLSEKPEKMIEGDLANIAYRIQVWANAPEPVAEPEYTEEELRKQKERLHLREKNKEYISLKEEFIPDYKERVNQRKAWQNKEKLAGRVSKDLFLLSNVCSTYEAEKKRFDSDLKKYYKQSEEISRLEHLYEAYVEARKKLLEVKKTFKQNLIPALMNNSSKLLSVMSEGKFNSLEISPEFELSVGGIRLELLSGSEKTLSNLALRISLGQVLTNKVFSVFIGDEVDASMDDSRAAAVASAMENLNRVFKQVFFVTHKNIDSERKVNVNCL